MNKSRDRVITWRKSHWALRDRRADRPPQIAANNLAQPPNATVLDHVPVRLGDRRERGIAKRGGMRI